MNAPSDGRDSTADTLAFHWILPIGQVLATLLVCMASLWIGTVVLVLSYAILLAIRYLKPEIRGGIQIVFDGVGTIFAVCTFTGIFWLFNHGAFWVTLLGAALGMFISKSIRPERRLRQQ
jgi:hypothetical protein